MKILLPIALAILGLGAGIGAGVALKPAPEPASVAAACVEGEGEGEGGACPEVAAADPFAPVEPAKAEHATPPAVVALDKPFVIPVFSGDKVVAMVVASVAVEIDAESETAVESAQPRLRDTFLAVMFRHANSGGFDGQFTTGRKMEDLRSALLVAARQVFAGKDVSDVLITEIARQDV